MYTYGTPTYGRAKAGQPARTYIQGYPCKRHDMMMMMMTVDEKKNKKTIHSFLCIRFNSTLTTLKWTRHLHGHLMHALNELKNHCTCTLKALINRLHSNTLLIQSYDHSTCIIPGLVKLLQSSTLTSFTISNTQPHKLITNVKLSVSLAPLNVCYIVIYSIITTQ